MFKVKTEHIKNGLITWYSAEVASMDWKLYALIPLVKISLSNLEREYGKYIKPLQDENGFIDIDELHKEYAQLIVKGGGMINIGPIQKVTVQDLDKLVAYIKQATPPQPTQPIPTQPQTTT